MATGDGFSSGFSFGFRRRRFVKSFQPTKSSVTALASFGRAASLCNSTESTRANLDAIATRLNRASEINTFND